MLGHSGETEAQWKRSQPVQEESRGILEGGLPGMDWGVSGKGGDLPCSQSLNCPSFTVSEIIGRDLSGFPAPPGEEPPA